MNRARELLELLPIWIHKPFTSNLTLLLASCPDLYERPPHLTRTSSEILRKPDMSLFDCQHIRLHHIHPSSPQAQGIPWVQGARPLAWRGVACHIARMNRYGTIVWERSFNYISLYMHTAKSTYVYTCKDKHVITTVYSNILLTLKRKKNAVS